MQHDVISYASIHVLINIKYVNSMKNCVFRQNAISVLDPSTIKLQFHVHFNLRPETYQDTLMNDIKVGVYYVK